MNRRASAPLGRTGIEVRNGWLSQRAQGPPIKALRQGSRPSRTAALGDGRASRLRPRVGRTQLDPLAEIGDHCGRKLLLWRHGINAVRSGNRLIENAGFQVAGHDRRPGSATLSKCQRAYQATALPSASGRSSNGIGGTSRPVPAGSWTRRIRARRDRRAHSRPRLRPAISRSKRSARDTGNRPPARSRRHRCVSQSTVTLAPSSVPHNCGIRPQPNYLTRL